MTPKSEEEAGNEFEGILPIPPTGKQKKKIVQHIKHSKAKPLNKGYIFPMWTACFCADAFLGAMTTKQSISSAKDKSK